MIKMKNFGAANNEELKIENGKLKVDDDVSNDGQWMGKLKSAPLEGEVRRRREGGLKEDMTGNGNQTPSAFSSQLAACSSAKGFTLTEDTDIALENISLSPLAGSKIASADINPSAVKHPPEAGERGLKRGCQGLKRGFTLAEVLITLVVIGVVAAITIPVLHSNTGGKEFNAAKQKARAGMGEAFKLASVNGDLPDITAKEYVKTVLPKYLKLAQTCDTPQECGFPNKIKTVDGNEVDITGDWKWTSYAPGLLVWNGNTPNGDWQHASRNINDTENTEAAFFRTADGFSAAMLYNPNCAVDQFDKAAYDYAQDTGTPNRAWAADQIAGQLSYDAACFNAVYDMNGAKGPNTVGKDIGFVGSFYSGISARSAAVLPAKNDTSIAAWNTASQRCKNLAPKGDYDLPTIDELDLIALNGNLAAGSSSPANLPGLPALFWSRSDAGRPSFFRHVNLGDGSNSFNTSGNAYVRCVRADKLM